MEGGGAIRELARVLSSPNFLPEDGRLAALVVRVLAEHGPLRVKSIRRLLSLEGVAAGPHRIAMVLLRLREMGFVYTIWPNGRSHPWWALDTRILAEYHMEPEKYIHLWRRVLSDEGNTGRGGGEA